jgi:hypothetical protein
MGNAFDLEAFDRYVEENGISDEEYPTAFARWVSDHSSSSGRRSVEGRESQEPEGRDRTPT